MFYVVKVTIEDEQKTQAIRPHEEEKSAVVDYHNEIANTIVYDTVQVCTVLLIDDYGKTLKLERYERPKEEPEPVMP